MFSWSPLNWNHPQPSNQKWTLSIWKIYLPIPQTWPEINQTLETAKPSQAWTQERQPRISHQKHSQQKKSSCPGLVTNTNNMEGLDSVSYKTHQPCGNVLQWEFPRWTPGHQIKMALTNMVKENLRSLKKTWINTSLNLKRISPWVKSKKTNIQVSDMTKFRIWNLNSVKR